MTAAARFTQADMERAVKTAKKVAGSERACGVQVGQPGNRVHHRRIDAGPTCARNLER